MGGLIIYYVALISVNLGNKVSSALLLLNGEPPSLRLFFYLYNLIDFYICTDGSVNFAGQYKKLPHAIIGDMDSISENEKKKFSNMMYTISDQETTDAEKAILFLQDKSYQHIHILGALGKRLDHTLYHLNLLAKYQKSNCKITIWGETEKIFLARSPFKLKGKIGDTISFFPLFGKVDILLEKGLKYSMNVSDFEFSKTVSISNEFNCNTIELNFSKNPLLVCLENTLF